MCFRLSRLGLVAFGVLLAATAMGPATPAPAQTAEAAAAPFDDLAGAWSGTGSITLGSGDKERIRCRVTYQVTQDGYRVEQDLRCASDSYKFELTCDLTYVNGNVTGRWNEKTRSTGGPIIGRAQPGRIDATAETSAFAAFITMVTRGNTQSVRIESKSPDISDVSITLRRSAR